MIIVCVRFMVCHNHVWSVSSLYTLVLLAIVTIYIIVQNSSLPHKTNSTTVHPMTCPGPPPCYILSQGQHCVCCDSPACRTLHQTTRWAASFIIFEFLTWITEGGINFSDSLHLPQEGPQWMLCTHPSYDSDINNLTGWA